MTTAIVATIACLGLMVAGIALIQIDQRSNQAAVASGVIVSVSGGIGALVSLVWFAVEVSKVVAR